MNRKTAPNYVTGDIRTVLFLYAPANGRLMDWKFQNSDDYQGVTVHDGLVLAVVKVALKPGRSMTSPCMCSLPKILKNLLFPVRYPSLRVDEFEVDAHL